MKSILSHDKASSRVYLMQLHPSDFPHIISHLDELADAQQYSKIFAKIPMNYVPAFVAEGYNIEATIPQLFKDEVGAAFVVKYKSEARSQRDGEALADFQQLLLHSSYRHQSELDADYIIRQLTEADVEAMVAVFKAVFDSYPFPVFDPEFLKESMEQGGTTYFGAFHNRRLAAISAAECNSDELYAEMTDFAVLPEHRGKRLAYHLLRFMEKDLIEKGVKTFFTICRLKELSMNKTFLNCKYQYSGTLFNNTQISGSIESMNVLYKNV